MEGDYILELKNVSKAYPGVRALDDVSIRFKTGEVHAIVGENGAGKSTLIKIITGAIKPTEGKIFYDGKEYTYFDPIGSLKMGIGAVYQEFNLVPYLSVAENVFYGREIRKGLFYDMKAMCAKTEEILEELGVRLNVKNSVNNLSVGYQQIVEIAKTISRNIRVLILDEPTAPLTNKEITSLFNIVRLLKAKGVTVVYISHRLEEIFDISDNVTVMRDGKYIQTLETAATSRKQLISLMVGRELGDDYPKRVAEERTEPVLQVKGLNTNYVHDIDFTLNKGEILGFAGLVGAGRTEVARAIYGADPVISGSITLNGKQVKIKSPEDAIKARIGLIPEDRKNHGILSGLSVGKNITFSCMRAVSNRGFINKKKEKLVVSRLVDKLRIKTHSYDQLLATLSGGNQQKVVLAKWLATNCEVLIFDEPTRGIDVGAKQEIYKLINELSNEGKSIIIISSEMPELLGMSDRIIVMHEGYIVGALNKNEANQELILEMASNKREESSYEN